MQFLTFFAFYEVSVVKLICFKEENFMKMAVYNGVTLRLTNNLADPSVLKSGNVYEITKEVTTECGDLAYCLKGKKGLFSPIWFIVLNHSYIALSNYAPPLGGEKYEIALIKCDEPIESGVGSALPLQEICIKVKYKKEINDKIYYIISEDDNIYIIYILK